MERRSSNLHQKRIKSQLKLLKVEFNDDSNGCIVVVPDHQLSLAIGKRGQNARLAAEINRIPY